MWRGLRAGGGQGQVSCQEATGTASELGLQPEGDSRFMTVGVPTGYEARSTVAKC